MIRVLVQAERGHARAGLDALTRARRGIHLLEPRGTGSLLDLVKELEPDVLLLDAPDGEATAALRALSGLPHSPAIVLLTPDASRAPSEPALRSGVRALLPPDATGAEILASVEAAAAGLVTLRPASVAGLPAIAPVAAPVAPPGRGGPGRDGPGRAARARKAPFSGPPGRVHDPGPQPLTARETEILAMLAEGLGNKLIAARLGISGHTVKFHLASIFDKLGAGSRTEAVTTGLRRGLILI